MQLSGYPFEGESATRAVQGGQGRGSCKRNVRAAVYGVQCGPNGQGLSHAQASRCRLVRSVYPSTSSAISLGLCTARRSNESGAASATASWFATYQALSRDSSSEKAGPRASAHSSRPTTVPADTPAPT
ncbi:hypothetical protein TSOC_009787 [Tetrabaena socialis]|uniref:Uncharacterized protein n=1 Tax=Tetrabaena socialis TaxID=47790 RepID=A0A2J7ZV02_9CHLO|nr:hypothetical protein TSOC_009787 [Tetrabaena socialis]|eukprot:PNH04103.1 hypothetical protein TSOC_009787 [Tetrabaena socialis]